jgi:hypothetical protein
MRSGLPPPEVSADEARRAAEEILARPEFRRPEPSPVERALDWVGERLGDLLRDLTAGGLGTVVAWVVLGLLVAVVVAVVVRVLRTTRRMPTRPPPLDVERRRPVADWRAEAERHEAAGDWKAALRCRYRALVVDLIARDLLDDVPGRTAGEYRREVADQAPVVAGEFAGASELFERAWYGDLPTGPDESRRFRELAERVEAGSSPARSPARSKGPGPSGSRS